MGGKWGRGGGGGGSGLINQSINRSIDQSIDQSINQSINQLIKAMHFRPTLFFLELTLSVCAADLWQSPVLLAELLSGPKSRRALPHNHRIERIITELGKPCIWFFMVIVASGTVAYVRTKSRNGGQTPEIGRPRHLNQHVWYCTSMFRCDLLVVEICRTRQDFSCWNWLWTFHFV